MRKSESSGEGAVGVGVVGDLSVTDDPAPDGGVATHPSPTVAPDQQGHTARLHAAHHKGGHSQAASLSSAVYYYKYLLLLLLRVTTVAS